MSTSSKFWNRIAEKYARRPIDNEAAYQHKLAATQKLLHPEMRLLEIGCGTGSTAITHAPKVQSIHAIDFSEKMIAIARTKAMDAGIDNITFEVQAIETLTAPDESYDIIMGMSILHLLPDRQQAIAKVHSLLKPGGTFVSSTMCLGDANPVFRLIIPMMRLVGLAPYVGIFNDNRLVEDLKNAGFTIAEQWRPTKSEALFLVAIKNS